MNDIVQITAQDHPWFPCLLLVTEVKGWGVQACVLIPESNSGSEPPSRAFTRLTWDEIEKVGTAIFSTRMRE